PRFADARRVVQRPGASRPITWRGSRVSAAVWALDDLAPGVTIAGPAILAGRDAAALIEPGGRGAGEPGGGGVVGRSGPLVPAGRDAAALIEPEWRGTVHPCGAVLVERT